MITSAFKRTAVGEIIDATAAKIQGEVVSCKSQTKCGSCGQENTDPVVFEMEEVFSSVLRWSMMKSLFKTFSYLSSFVL